MHLSAEPACDLQRFCGRAFQVTGAQLGQCGRQPVAAAVIRQQRHVDVEAGAEEELGERNELTRRVGEAMP